MRRDRSRGWDLKTSQCDVIAVPGVGEVVVCRGLVHGPTLLELLSPRRLHRDLDGVEALAPCRRAPGTQVSAAGKHLALGLQEAPSTETSASPSLSQGWVPVKETEKVSIVCAAHVEVPYYLFPFAENQVSGLSAVAHRKVQQRGGMSWRGLDKRTRRRAGG